MQKIHQCLAIKGGERRRDGKTVGKYVASSLAVEQTFSLEGSFGQVPAVHGLTFCCQPVVQSLDLPPY